MKAETKFTPESWKQYIAQNSAVLLYLYNSSCDICNTLRPKIKDLVQQSFPKIEMVTINAAKNKELAGQLRMLSAPGIILYMDAKELFRANGLIVLSDLEARIRRPYEFMFK